MYCVKCGVKLADTEKKCPLCDTAVYHPEIKQAETKGLYPNGKMPKEVSGRAVICGTIIILFMIPLLIAFNSDMLRNGRLDWFGYVAGGITLLYLWFAFPFWFKKPNPIILLPCDFAAGAVYLFFLNHYTGGDWFFSLALPITVAVAVTICALVTLLRYLRRGRLYVVGGFFIGLGALALTIELHVDVAFGLSFIGWSLYPLIVLAILGGLLIYLAINSVAREEIERKLFF